MGKIITMIAAANGFLAVALGAFGAHGLRKILEANQRMQTYETAVSYHFYHALALLGLGLFIQNNQNERIFKI